jgi:hypothetical protein
MAAEIDWNLASVIEQEKSIAVFRTPDRPDLNNAFTMSRMIASNRRRKTIIKKLSTMSGFPRVLSGYM